MIKKDASKIKAAIEVAKKADAIAVHEAALKDAYQHGWDDCVAAATAKQIATDAEAAALVAEIVPATKTWWDKLWT